MKEDFSIKSHVSCWWQCGWGWGLKTKQRALRSRTHQKTGENFTDRNYSRWLTTTTDIFYAYLLHCHIGNNERGFEFALLHKHAPFHDEQKTMKSPSLAVFSQRGTPNLWQLISLDLAPCWINMISSFHSIWLPTSWNLISHMLFRTDAENKHKSIQ